MHLLTEAGAGLAQYGIAFGIATGFIGALVTLYKLRGDRDSQAVSQAQGAVETMAEVQEQLEKALARASERADFYKKQWDDAVHELETVNHRWGPFPIDEES